MRGIRDRMIWSQSSTATARSPCIVSTRPLALHFRSRATLPRGMIRELLYRLPQYRTPDVFVFFSTAEGRAFRGTRVRSTPVNKSPVDSSPHSVSALPLAVISRRLTLRTLASLVVGWSWSTARRQSVIQLVMDVNAASGSRKVSSAIRAADIHHATLRSVGGVALTLTLNNDDRLNQICDIGAVGGRFR